MPSNFTGAKVVAGERHRVEIASQASEMMSNVVKPTRHAAFERTANRKPHDH
jgi:hypothetical protein